MAPDSSSTPARLIASRRNVTSRTKNRRVFSLYLRIRGEQNKAVHHQQQEGKKKENRRVAMLFIAFTYTVTANSLAACQEASVLVFHSANEDDVLPKETSSSFLFFSIYIKGMDIMYCTLD